MNDQQPKTTGHMYRTVFFLGTQLAVVAAVVGATRAKVHEAERRRMLPQLRPKPISVRPLHDDPQMVSDEQLGAVLSRLRPRLRGPEPRIYDVAHALRFWGAEARFRDEACLSGHEIRQILVHRAKFAEVWGPDEKPLLFRDRLGVGVRVKEGLATTSHDDHLLAGLAEAGTPLDFPVATQEGKARVHLMVERSLRTFSLNQPECEWSALAYALYLPPAGTWVSSEGQEITFDRIADRLMRGRLSRGPCYGNHRLHVLVILLRVDDLHPLLTPECRAKILDYLQNASATLTESQHPAGFWDKTWASGEPRSESEVGDESETPGPLSDRLQVTGHVLEWLALAPEEVLPPRDVLRRASQWLVQAVMDMEEDEIREGYAFLTHAGRALALWRGRFPAEFIDSIEFEDDRANDKN
jgi:hypothetical protein